MASPGRDPQEAVQSLRLLDEGLKFFATKMGGHQQMLLRTSCQGLSPEERQQLNESLGQCLAGMSLLAAIVRSRHLRLDVDRTLLLVEQAELDGQLEVCEERLRVAQCELQGKRLELLHQMAATARMGQSLAAAKERIQELEERNRKLEDLRQDKTDLYESRGVMLCYRGFDISQQLILTRMRVNDFENACTQLRRRILELKLRRVQRRRLLCQEVQRLRLAHEQQVPPVLVHLWHRLRFVWNCVNCLAQVTGVDRPQVEAKSKMDALHLFVAGF
ncbi:uncharacterized protein LOC108097162 [Drosophila ficusphila]|uniref:uncharacterized protein LOC108097162 n=1 Tax=Drosophila ficusphila TaxID=30025 RepID=UPI0007E65DD9|nr:uncharacterized protein LOC108097162 [Drosophila ficusphila]